MYSKSGHFYFGETGHFYFGITKIVRIIHLMLNKITLKKFYTTLSILINFILKS